MEDKKKFKPNQDLKLMDQVREVLRYYHYAYRTEQTYCDWIKRYLKFYEMKRHPKDMGAAEVERYLSHLATEGKVAASTQRQALNAIMFLYREVLDIELGEISPIRSKKQRKPPTVLTQQEVLQILRVMEGTHRVMAQLLYGCGLRLMECIRLRVQDLDFGQGRIFVRGGKGGKDRTVVLPETLRVTLAEHVEKVSLLHAADLREGFGEVYIPEALARKYPNACRETGWQYVFPSKNRSVDPRSGKVMRHHVKESGLQKAVKTAVRQVGITKRVGCHTLRHSYATHLLENGTNMNRSRWSLFALQIIFPLRSKAHGARADGAQGCEDDGNLYPRDGKGYRCSEEPAGFAVGWFAGRALPRCIFDRGMPSAAAKDELQDDGQQDCFHRVDGCVERSSIVLLSMVL